MHTNDEADTALLTNPACDVIYTAHITRNRAFRGRQTDEEHGHEPDFPYFS
jgi:hypothetical protein